MKKYGITLDFKDKMVTIDEVKLPMQNINYQQGSSSLCELKLNHSLAMEPHSIQDATKRVTQILDTLVGNVADMLATCRPDTRCCSNSGQMGPCCRHKI
jgi:hypothetical protein